MDGNAYVVDGAKTYISNGQQADLVITAVKTDPSQGAKGVSLMVVETADAPGFRRGRNLDKIGQHSADTSELFFEDVREESAEALIARQAFVLREGGAAGVGERWFSTENEAEFTAAVDITREIGESRFTVLEWDGAAPPEEALPDDVIEVRRARTDFVGTPVGLVTYEFVVDD